jgi:hypothetical protein
VEVFLGRQCAAMSENRHAVPQTVLRMELLGPIAVLVVELGLVTLFSARPHWCIKPSMQSAVPSASDDLSVKNTTHSNTPRWWHSPNLPWILAYVLVASFTGAFFMADTVDYVAAAYRHNPALLPDQGVNYLDYFWDFRHLLWRPLGWGLLHLLNPWLSPAARSEPRVTAIYIFLILNWVAGLFSLFLLRAVLRRFCSQWWAIEFSTVAFISSLGFLNYLHSGSPYIPGLTFLLLGLNLLAGSVEPGASKYLKYGAPLSLAISVCLWFPYAFAVPGALALPLFYPDRIDRRWPLVWRTTIICLLIGVSAYAWVLIHLGIYTVPGIIHWVGQGASNVAGARGVNRTVFGFAHSFIDLGRDGVLFKRFQLHDPYNPVSLRQLVVRISLCELALFYALLVAMIVQLARSGKRNVLAFCAFSAAPVLVFAVFWFGGDIERYLPLYPAFFIAFCCAVAEKRHGLTKILAAVFVAAAVGSNWFAVSRPRLQHQQQIVADRVQDLLPLLKPSSRVVEVDIHDDLVNFSRSFPLNPINRRSNLHNYALLNPGTAQVLHWRQDFAATVMATWNAHGDVWVSQRVLATRPKAIWEWIEKSDPHVTWGELPAFFSQFDFGTAVGDGDGFLPLLPTPKNLSIVDSFAIPK